MREDMQHYNSTTPKQYQPQTITIPIALFYGGNDDLADPKDVQHLIPLLKNVVFSHFEPNYSHIDFVCSPLPFLSFYFTFLFLFFSFLRANFIYRSGE